MIPEQRLKEIFKDLSIDEAIDGIEELDVSCLDDDDTEEEIDFD